ncbi:MAG: glycerate kinase [Planctomycetota bacterium]|jgi:glycerate kinase|nr:glycerate kinase [Planctomycetota bacterium]
MKIVVAPNAFKDSLTAAQAAEAISRGLRTVLPEIRIARVPIADGGDGLFQVFHSVFGGEIIDLAVTGPLGEKREAQYLFIPESRTAVIEMARASGLALLKPEERNARMTTTRGTGELILAALERGAGHVIVGIGGSATNDGGVGFASALGIGFLDAAGRPVRPVGEDLGKIRRIDLSGRRFDPAGVAFEAVCDVDNPLCGERGAAAVYGPQKGASPEDVKFLDAGLAGLAELVREQLGLDLAGRPGSGAAGGLGFGLAAFAGARLRPGVEVVLDMVGIDRELADADLALTAEGRIDFQTAFGKGPAGVGGRARKKGVPCLALAGGVAGNIANLHEIGIDACFSLCPGPMTLAEAMAGADELLANAAAQAFRSFLAGRRGASRAGPEGGRGG